MHTRSERAKVTQDQKQEQQEKHNRIEKSFSQSGIHLIFNIGTKDKAHDI